MPEVLASLQQVLAQSKEAAGFTDSQDSDQRSYQLLLVDDDDVFRLSMREALIGLGYRVLEANSGQLALELLQRNRMVDLVLLDALMPEMDGFDVCEQMQQDHEQSKIPVIMVTGLDDIDSVNKAFDVGAAGFIHKPANYALLGHEIKFQIRASENALALNESRERLISAQKVAGLGYWSWNTDTGHFTLSDQLKKMLGRKGVMEINSMQDYLRLVNAEDYQYVSEKMNRPGSGPEIDAEGIDYRIRTHKNQEIIVHQVVDRSMESDGAVLGTVQDVTAQRAAERRVRQLAYTDELTGLASRAYFYKHLGEILASARRREEQFAILYLDLDGFKDINDSLGHDVGDDLLKAIAQRLLGAIRENDFLARLSGDEFCIVLDNVDDQINAADAARRCLEATNKSIALGSQHIVKPRCSIGIAHYPNDGSDVQTLLKAADSAMYAAKSAGRHRYAFYRAEFTEQAERRLQIEQDLRRAIDREQLELYYQPQIELKTGEMYGVEALVRWIHPEKGVISPGEFIHVAERIGMIRQLGEWVLSTAARQAAEWFASGLPRFKVSVNISPNHFHDPSLVGYVREVLKKTGIPAAKLELELTESVMQTVEQNVDIFNRLRDMGVTIAIDDFGTGYSSLASLKHLPIDTLKIDRMFIVDMLNDADSAVLLGTIIGVAHALNKSVVAEGVEESDQVRALWGMDCNQIQGYFFSTPVTPDQIPELAKTNFRDRYLAAEE